MRRPIWRHWGYYRQINMPPRRNVPKTVVVVLAAAAAAPAAAAVAAAAAAVVVVVVAAAVVVVVVVAAAVVILVVFCTGSIRGLERSGEPMGTHLTRIVAYMFKQRWGLCSGSPFRMRGSALAY